MKDFVWVVEVKRVDGWEAMDFEPIRSGARALRTWRRSCGYVARVRKYQRVGK